MSTTEEADAFIESIGWDPDDEIERIAMDAFRQLDKAGKLMDIKKEAKTLAFTAILGAAACAIAEAFAMAAHKEIPWTPVNIAKAAVVGAISAPVQRTGVLVLRSTLKLPAQYKTKES